MKAVKAVRFQYYPNGELIALFNVFRQMTNDAIRIAIRHRITSRFRLIKTVYDDLKRYQLHTHYILSACEVACGSIRNKKRRRTPYIPEPVPEAGQPDIQAQRRYSQDTCEAETVHPPKAKDGRIPEKAAVRPRHQTRISNHQP